MNENEGLGRTPGGPVEQTEEATKRVFYAWLGAMATAYDTAEEQFETFVRRGREVAGEWQERKSEARESRRQNARMRDSWRVMMDAMMDGMNMPTKAEVDAMNVKLNILMRKLDDLAAQTAAPPRDPGGSGFSGTETRGGSDLAT